MTVIELGPGHRVDLARLIDTRLLIQANSGGGKSWALRRLLEQTHGKVQQLVIDPEGEFATLRERYDYVLAARQHGDTVADPRSAKLLAEKLLDLGVSAVLDIYELKAHDRVRFVRAFLEAMVDAPKRLWHPVVVVVDEAHVFAPQQGEAESASAVIDLATRGRKRGFCAVLATQRLSKLHKDAAAECNNKLIGRTGLDVDVKRASDELGFGKERWRELRELQEGHFFGFGPALSREVAAVRVGPVQTTHPKAGSRIAFTPPPPTAKVKALLPQLADLPAEAEERARSLEDLRKENAALKRQLTLAQRGTAVTVQEKSIEKRVEVPAVSPEVLARLEAAADTFLDSAQRLKDAAKIAQEAAGIAWRETSQALEQGRALQTSARRVLAAPAPARPAVQPSRATPRPAARSTSAAAGLTGPEQRILDAIAWLESIGVTEPEQSAVAFVAGYTIGGGAFNNPRGALRSKGLVDYAGDRILLTNAGRELANPPEAALTTDELHRRVLDRLPGPEQRILRPLLEAYPESLTNEELAAQAGYEPRGGAFNNPRGRLRSLGLIEYTRDKRVTARPILFPEGG